MQAIFGLYERIGYGVLYASAAAHTGIDELRTLLSGRITVVTGPSGVGKSSLLNAVHPDLHLRTGDLRDFAAKGRHTTRAAQLLPPALWRADLRGRHARHPRAGPLRHRAGELWASTSARCCLPARLPLSRLHARPRAGLRRARGGGEGAIAQERYDSYLRLLHGEE